MIYEAFFRWLFRKKQKCDHDWKDTGWVYSEWREFWKVTGFRHKWVCLKCGKKEKRAPRDPPSNFMRF